MNNLGTRYKVDKKSPVPLYAQLKTLIAGEIASGALVPGDLLPSETELVQALSISRPTVRQALSDLAAEGYINKERGRGSFVAYPKIEGQFLNKLQSFDEEMRQQRRTPSTRVMSLTRIGGVPGINDHLGIPLSDDLLEIVRLRFADGTPVVYVKTCLPYAPFADLLTADLGNVSLYATLEKEYNVRVGRVVRHIEAAAALPSEADLLQVKHGAPICLVHTTAFAQDNRAVEYSVASYRGDVTAFSVELYR